jgi:hypothetical protein
MDENPDPEDLLPGLEVPIVTPPAGGRCHADPEFLLQVLREWGARVVFGEEADWHDPKLREIGRAVAQFAGELAQARKGQGRGPQRHWSRDRVQRDIDNGMPLRAAARQESLRTGEKLTTIERAMRAARAHKK